MFDMVPNERLFTFRGTPFNHLILTPRVRKTLSLIFSFGNMVEVLQKSLETLKIYFGPIWCNIFRLPPDFVKRGGIFFEFPTG